MISQRLIEAIARGEVTKGGMAEAGWFDVGKLADEEELWLQPLKE